MRPSLPSCNCNWNALVRPQLISAGRNANLGLPSALPTSSLLCSQVILLVASFVCRNARTVISR